MFLPCGILGGDMLEGYTMLIGYGSELLPSCVNFSGFVNQLQRLRSDCSQHSSAICRRIFRPFQEFQPDGIFNQNEVPSAVQLSPDVQKLTNKE
jgi:hypothetical protein